MKSKLLPVLVLLLVLVPFTRGADLTFSTPPQDTDNATILMQKQAVSLWALRGGFPGTVNIGNRQGAANIATGQVVASTTSGQLVASRATRRSVAIKNIDTAITVYYGAGTVTSATGFPLKPGESQSVDTVAAVNVIAPSGTPIVAYVETYD